jgi:hypothetical protein
MKIDNKSNHTNEDIVCLLINCTKDQLNDDVFLSTKLEEFSFYQVKNIKNWNPIPRYLSLEEYKALNSSDKGYYYLKEITPKLLLKLLKTDINALY